MENNIVKLIEEQVRDQILQIKKIKKYQLQYYLGMKIGCISQSNQK